ncbi:MULTISPECIES: hypothetical protein [Kosmotoga]|nr:MULTISPECIES: hypothetical protein [Kosmotoga]OAA19496.1 hypothetical protein DU53_10625 [Kosmotoga sp. DU53]
MKKGFSLVGILMSLVATIFIVAVVFSVFTEFNLVNSQYMGTIKHILELKRAFEFFERDLLTYQRTIGTPTSTRFSFMKIQDGNYVRVTYYITEDKRVVRSAKQNRKKTGVNTIAQYKKEAKFEYSDGIITLTIDSYSLSHSLNEE